MSFASNQLYCDLATTSLVAISEYASIFIIGDHDIGIAMHDEYRHLVGKQALEIVDGVVTQSAAQAPLLEVFR